MQAFVRSMTLFARRCLMTPSWRVPLISGDPPRPSLFQPRPAWHTRFAASNASTRRVAAAIRASAASSGPSLSPDADVKEAINVACILLGRISGAAEAALVERLHDNWFHTAADLAAISDAEAASLKLPLRLRSTVAALLEAQQAQQQPQQAGSGEVLSAAAMAGLAPAAAQSWSQPAVAELPGTNGQGPGQGQGQQQQQVAASDPLEASGSSPLQGPQLGLEVSSDGGAGSSSVLLVEDSGDRSLDGIPIEDRICPPIQRAGNRTAQAPKLMKKSVGQPYALKEAEISEALRTEFAAFLRFCTVRFFGAQTDPIAVVTAEKYASHMRQFLGWLHREREVPLSALSFSAGLPSVGREGVSLAFDYLQWLRGERGVGVRTERMALRAIQHAAKFLYHGQSKVRVGSGDKPYSDLEIVKELRQLDSTVRKEEKVAPRQADEALKWLDWPEYLALVGELRRECAGKDHHGRPRSPVAVAWSLQRYLMFGILSCVPDRQRTLRELEVGRTLFKDKNRWMIRHGPTDYKTGRTYGERPPLVIAEHLYPELEAFIEKWRAFLKPTHGLLFSQQGGKPMTEQGIYRLFTTTSYRLTGKRCNPHLVRDSIVTYLRGAGASERELEALALYMAHSIDMQRDTYDRRTKQQKVEPAVELLESLNKRVLPARQAQAAGTAGTAGSAPSSQ